MQKTPPKAYFATINGGERVLVFDYTQIHLSNKRSWYAPEGVNTGRSWYRLDELSDLTPAYLVDPLDDGQMTAIWAEFYAGYGAHAAAGYERMKQTFEALVKKATAPEIPEEPPVWSTRLDVNGTVWGRVPGTGRWRWSAEGKDFRSWEDLYPTLVKEDK